MAASGYKRILDRYGRFRSRAQKLPLCLSWQLRLLRQLPLDEVGSRQMMIVEELGQHGAEGHDSRNGWHLDDIAAEVASRVRSASVPKGEHICFQKLCPRAVVDVWRVCDKACVVEGLPRLLRGVFDEGQLLLDLVD